MRLRKNKGKREGRETIVEHMIFSTALLWTFPVPQHPCLPIPGDGPLVSLLANSQSQTNVHALTLLRNLEELQNSFLLVQ